ncbi:MAG: AraC family transcriptional regulator [Oscillospiraceae bacterium]|nr:AraC family transcriptional regulator [Oscillospiraceae bacterium]
MRSEEVNVISWQTVTNTQQFTGVPASDLLLVMCSGRTIIRMNNRQYYMQPFTFLLHPFDSDTLSLFSSSIVCRCIHLRFSEDSIQTLHEKGLRMKEVHTLTRPLTVDELWKLLTDTANAKTPSGEAIRVHAIKLLLCLLCESLDGTVTRAAEIPHYDKFSALRHEIYQHPERSWFIQDICDSMGISRAYFHRIYTAAFGTTCIQDVIASRLTCAKRLLETTDNAVSVISQQCGFETEVYFMRQFKRHVGMTPTVYRRMFRQTAQERETGEFEVF